MPTQNIYDLVDTWASGGGPYTSIKMDATDNDAASASLLMDLKVGGASRFSVTKGGSLQIFTPANGATQLTTRYGFIYFGGATSGDTSASCFTVDASNVRFKGRSTAELGWTSSSTDGNATLDTILTRRAAANLRLGAADAALASTVAQILSVQSVTGTDVSAATRPFKITGAQGTGTGTGGSIVFQVAPAGGTGAAQNTPVDALTIGADRTTTLTGALTFLVSGGDTATHTITTNSGGYITFARGADVGLALYEPGGYVQTRSDGHFGWTASSSPAMTVDLKLSRDDSNKLALRNGTAAQRFNVYNTWTTATNYEAFKIDWITTANTVLVGTEKGSVGGTARALEFQTNGTTRLTIPSNGGVWTTSGEYFHFRSSANTSASVLSPADGVMTLGNWNADNFNRLQFGGTSSSFPALKRNGAGIDVVGADGTNVSFVRVPGVAVASLPSAATAGVGARSFVTDATATTYASTVAGGGANKVPVFSDGTNWIIG